MTPESPQIQRGLRTFFTIWFGQLFSIVGSALSSFALGVWVYMETGSTMRFVLISLLTLLPHILFGPFAGALADRWNRRWAMIVGDSGSAMSMLGVLLLLHTEQLEFWHIYIATFVSSAFNALHWPAFSAAVTQLVPQQHLARANGFIQLAEAMAPVFGPVAAGFLVARFGVVAVLAIDFGTFVVALATLLMARIPDVEREAQEDASKGKGGIWQEVNFGFRYLRARADLRALLIFFAALNLCMGMSLVLITPLVLSFTTPDVLGAVLSGGAVGGILGSLVMSAWGGPKRRVQGMLLFTFFMGLAVFSLSLHPSALLVGAGVFALIFLQPQVNSLSQTIWQTKVAVEIQGRVFAVRRMLAWCTSPLAYVLAGALSDRVFEPLVTNGGSLSSTMGALIGTEPGRGIAAVLLLSGVLTVLLALVGGLSSTFRSLEKGSGELGEESVEPVLATETAAQP